MKVRKKICITSLLLFILIMLSSCGVASNDKLIIDSEFNGSRVMNININKDDLDRISGGSSSLKSFLEKNVKEPLSYEIINESEDNFEFNLTMNFQDLDDYINQSIELFKRGGIDTYPTVIFEKAKDSVFSSGINFTDNIKTQDLLHHLIKKSVEQAVINQKDSSSIWKENKYSLIYNGEALISQDKNPPYNVNTLEYVGPSEYIIATVPSSPETWTRQISVVIDKNNISKLNTSWKDKLALDGVTKELEPIDVIASNGKKSLAYRFIIENRSLETIEEATASLLEGKDNIDISVKSKLDSFQLEYKVSETIYERSNDNQALITSIYYKEPVATAKLVPYKDEEINNSIINEDHLLATQSQLNDGFSDSILIKANYDSADIKTFIDTDCQLKRNIQIKNRDSFYSHFENKLLKDYLKSHGIQGKDEDGLISFSYEGDSFAEKNALFFDSNPNVNLDSNNAFRYKISYKEAANFNKIPVDNMTQSVEGPSLSKSIDNSSKVTNTSLNNDMIFEGYKNYNISLVLIIGISALIITLVFIIIKKLVNKKSNNKKSIENEKYKADNMQKQDREKRVSQETQPIPTVKVDEEGNVIEDKKNIDVDEKSTVNDFQDTIGQDSDI